MFPLLLSIPLLIYYKQDRRLIIFIILLVCLYLKHGTIENFINTKNLLKNTEFLDISIINIPTNIDKILNSNNTEEINKLRYNCELNKYVGLSKSKHPWNFNSKYIDIKSIDLIDDTDLSKLNITTDKKINNGIQFTINNNKSYIYSYNQNIQHVDNIWIEISVDVANLTKGNIQILPYLSNHINNNNKLKFNYLSHKYKKINKNNKMNTVSWLIFLKKNTNMNSLNFLFKDSKNLTCILANPAIYKIKNLEEYLNKNYKQNSTIGYQIRTDDNKIIGDHGICKFPFNHNNQIHHKCIDETINKEKYSWCKLENNKKAYCTGPKNNLIIPLNKTEHKEINLPSGEKAFCLSDNNKIITPIKKNKYVNKKLTNLIKSIYLDNIDQPNPVISNDYINLLTSKIKLIDKSDFKFFIKELCEPLLNDKTLDKETLAKRLKLIIEQNIEVYNKINSTHKLDVNQSSSILNFLLSTPKVQSSSITNNNKILKNINLTDKKWKKKINNIITTVFDFYKKNKIDTIYDFEKNITNELINKNKNSMKYIAQYINYDNIVDLIESSIKYNDTLWEFHKNENSVTFNYWIELIEKLNMTDSLRILKKDIYNNENIYLDYDDFMFNTIFLVMNIIIQSTNNYIETPLKNPITFELYEFNPRLNKKIINKVNELIYKLLKPFKTTDEINEIIADRQEITAVNEDSSDYKYDSISNLYNETQGDIFKKQVYNINSNIDEEIDEEIDWGIDDPDNNFQQIIKERIDEPSVISNMPILPLEVDTKTSLTSCKLNKPPINTTLVETKIQNKCHPIV